MAGAFFSFDTDWSIVIAVLMVALWRGRGEQVTPSTCSQEAPQLQRLHAVPVTLCVGTTHMGKAGHFSTVYTKQVVAR